MFAVFSILLTSLISFATTIQGNPNTEYAEYDFNGMEKITVLNTSGKTNIHPMPVNKAIIAIVKRNFSDLCKATIDRPDIFTVVIEVTKPLGTPCEADIDIQAPPTVDLDLTTSSGPVNISGLSGNLKFKTASGAVQADGKFKSVTGNSGSGDIKIEGMTHGGSIEAGTGKVDLSFLGDPTGDLKINMGTGSAALKFPKGSKINAQLNSEKGTTQNEFYYDPSSDFDVKLKSDSGNLSVKSY
jgi:hypothetical protein